MPQLWALSPTFEATATSLTSTIYRILYTGRNITPHSCGYSSRRGACVALQSCRKAYAGASNFVSHPEASLLEYSVSKNEITELTSIFIAMFNGFSVPELADNCFWETAIKCSIRSINREKRKLKDQSNGDGMPIRNHRIQQSLINQGSDSLLINVIDHASIRRFRIRHQIVSEMLPSTKTHNPVRIQVHSYTVTLPVQSP